MVRLNLPDEDVEFLDTYAREQGLSSRAVVVHKAVRLLRAVELSDGYERAWQDWSGSEDDRLWSLTVVDSLTT